MVLRPLAALAIWRQGVKMEIELLGGFAQKHVENEINVTFYTPFDSSHWAVFETVKNIFQALF